MLVRTSEDETPLSRVLRYFCAECTFSAVAQLALIRQLTPSQRPNQHIHLPLCNPNIQHFKKRPGSNDDQPLPANDEDAPAAAKPDPMSG